MIQLLVLKLMSVYQWEGSDYFHITIEMGAMQTYPHVHSNVRGRKSSGNYQTSSSGGFSLMGHDISCVLPPVNGVGGLYIGSIHPARDYQLLQQMGIKAVVTAAVEANLHYDHSIVPYHLIVNAQDTAMFNIGEYMGQAIEFIRRCLKTTNVLVHCMAGISRSATLVIAYLMTDKGMSQQEATNYLRSKRQQIYPNEGFVMQLKEYELSLGRRGTASSMRRMDTMSNLQPMSNVYGNNQYNPTANSYNPNNPFYQNSNRSQYQSSLNPNAPFRHSGVQ